MPTTPTRGLPYPANTDLVSQGYDAIADLALAVEGELDDVEAAAVPKTLADAKGDLLAATAADTVARLPVGADGEVLTADSGAATGVAWAPPVASAASGTTTAVGASSGTGFAQPFGMTFATAPAVAIAYRQAGVEVVVTAKSTTGFTFDIIAAPGNSSPIFDWVAL